jgi:hypothetical protein
LGVISINDFIGRPKQKTNNLSKKEANNFHKLCAIIVITDGLDYRYQWLPSRGSLPFDVIRWLEV